MERNVEGSGQGGTERAMHGFRRGENIGVEDIYVEMTSSS